MFNIFNKNKFEIVSPGKGILKSISEVKDEVFSSKALWDGFIVEPTIGEVYLPVDGVVMATFPTKHAIGIKCNNGIEILVHIGVDTVQFSGEKCEIKKAGQVVNIGEKDIVEIKSK